MGWYGSQWRHVTIGWYGSQWRHNDLLKTFFTWRHNGITWCHSAILEYMQTLPFWWFATVAYVVVLLVHNIINPRKCPGIRCRDTEASSFFRKWACPLRPVVYIPPDFRAHAMPLIGSQCISFLRAAKTRTLEWELLVIKKPGPHERSGNQIFFSYSTVNMSETGITMTVPVIAAALSL